MILGLALLAQVACSSAGELCASPDEPQLAEPPVQVAPVVDCGLPICGGLGLRLYCIEGFESRHFGGAYNPSSGAAGWLQWLPGTARAWGASVGNRASEWAAASRIAAVGESFFRSQWSVLRVGLC